MPSFEVKDYYFHKAKREGFKARSVFKLKEIDEELQLIKPNFKALDLGSTPGSWLQYLGQKIHPQKGLVIGLDLNPIDFALPPHVFFKIKDVFLLTKEDLKECDLFDIILSDMAPKTTGIKHVDQIRSLALCEKALELSDKFLKEGGHLVVKIFQGSEVSNLVFKFKQVFKTVKQIKPKGVRSVSKEFYLVGLNKKENL